VGFGCGEERLLPQRIGCFLRQPSLMEKNISRGPSFPKRGTHGLPRLERFSQFCRESRKRRVRAELIGTNRPNPWSYP
jgi:hypothetical protein